jgi:hypothetical protein
MDSYRGQLVENDRSNLDSAAYDLDTGEDDIGREPPPDGIGQDERRMQVRAYNYWASLLGDRNFPSIKDLTSTDLPDFAGHAVVLDFSKGIENPAVTLLGSKLAQECGATKTIKRLSDVPGRSLLSRITDHYMQILANQAPIGFEAEFLNQRGQTVLYRGILLPFSSDGEKIQHIMGVINWKEVADQHTTAELQREVESALVTVSPTSEKPARAAKPSRTEKSAPSAAVSAAAASAADLANGPLTEWADGPAGEASGDPSSDEWALADWLAAAREMALVANGSEDRSRAALYSAIGRAWDFALAAENDPQAFEDIVATAGLSVQARAPMTPVVKLVFGADYDKTRLTEYASALAHARRQGLGRGTLAAYLAQAPGGLKGIVCEERKLRRVTDGKAPEPDAQREKLAARLRELPTQAIKDIARDGSEFAVLMIRRLPDGKLRLVGEVGDDLGLLERAAKHLLQ